MKLIRSILSLSFAVLVLFSSSSFVVGIHRCMGSVQSIALFDKAKGCGMEMPVPPCHKPMAEPCCQDETITYHAQYFKGDVTQLTLNAVLGLEVSQLGVVLSEVIPALPLVASALPDYDPPLRSQHGIAALQVFRI